VKEGLSEYAIRQGKFVSLTDIRIWKWNEANVDKIKALSDSILKEDQVKFEGVPLIRGDNDLQRDVADVGLEEGDTLIVELPKALSQFRLVPLHATEIVKTKPSSVNATTKISQKATQSTSSSAAVSPNIPHHVHTNRPNFDHIQVDKGPLAEILPKSGRAGVVGLLNLGNTCFMSSSIHCLSNTLELTEYFCKKLYEKDINVENRLGSGGELAIAYAELVREMWFGDASKTAPYELKTILGRKVQKFQGYGQQDSCELLNYLLDILHEDLNRVREKPYVEVPPSNGRPDDEVSREHWQAYLSRNQSIVIDLMSGQLKSTVQCLKCQSVAVNFDPFLTLPVPIARSTSIEALFVPYAFTDEKGYKKSHVWMQVAV